MSAKTQEPQRTKITDLSNADSKFITLQKIEFVDQLGKQRVWERATRKTRNKEAGVAGKDDDIQESGVDAIAMGNILIQENQPAKTLIVIQYRPPLDKFTVEWPAGLMDKGETAEETAVREFKEETGYDCEVLSTSPAQAADPGMTNANMQLVMVKVKFEKDDAMPEQRLEDGEHIERKIVPLSELYDVLVDYSKEKPGEKSMIVAAKLFHFAAGMRFAEKFAKTGTYGGLD